MTKQNGLPCRVCGTSDWTPGGNCKQCARKRSRDWQESNRDRHVDSSRKWRQANPDKASEIGRVWRENNPEKLADRVSRWTKANPDKRAASKQRRRSKKAGGGSFTSAEWKILCGHYGNKCLRCGRNDVKLTADHIIPVSRGGTGDIDNIQPLCGSCNSAKGDRYIDYRPDAGAVRWLQAKLFG